MSSTPKPVQAPFQQQQQQANTYGTMSVAGSPEARALLDTQLDFGQGQYTGDAYKDVSTDFDVDPGAGRRTDLAEQSAQNRWDSAFNGGLPPEYRMMLRDSERRQIRSQGASEARQAQYANQQARNAATVTKAQMRDQSEQVKAGLTGSATAADLERKRLLLPQIVQTGGSGSSSGYNTEIVQPQPGFWSNLATGVASGLAGNSKI